MSWISIISLSQVHFSEFPIVDTIDSRIYRLQISSDIDTSMNKYLRIKVENYIFLNAIY